MTTRIKLRRDTAANWTAQNPILAAGEPGYETDTGKTKYGDGVKHWVDLAYATGIPPRTAVGYFMFHGPVPNTIGTDWWFEGVETDTAGNAYYVGGRDSGGNPHVVKVDVNGEVQWQKEITWADGYEGAASSAVYNAETDKLVVVAEMWKNWGVGVGGDNDLGAAVITMDPATGAVVGNPIMIRDEVTSDGTLVGEIDPSDIVLTPAGNPVVVGHRDGAATPYALTTSSVGEIGIIYVATSSFGAGKLPLAYNNWYITGTNITSEVQVTDVNYYESQSATTLVGTGTNATFTSRWRLGSSGQVQFPDWAEHYGVNLNQQGTDYNINDTLYLNPKQYGGLTSATITVTGVGASGEIGTYSVTGTFDTSVLKLQVGSSIDFTTDGAWTAKNYSSEAFVWTQDWTLTFGGSGFDKVNAAATDSAGNIYLACQTYDDTAPNDGMTMPVLIKLDSSGNKLWAKAFSPDGYYSDDNGYTGVVVDSNDDVIVVENYVVTKINGAGTPFWQRLVGNMAPMGMWNTCVDVDSHDNVYVASEYDYMGQTTNDDYLIIKFDSSGRVLWQRDIGTGADEDTNWNNGLQILSVTDDFVHIAGSSYQGGDDVGFGISFPADGSGTQQEHFGQFFYHTTTWSVNTTTAVVSAVAGLSFTATMITLTTETNMTIIDSDSDTAIRMIRTGDVDGRIENLYSISFEDGTVQKTAYSGALQPADNGYFFWDTNDFYPRLQHANRMMYWRAPGWNDAVEIYIPHNDDVPFAIGTQMHFFKDQGIRAFMFWPWSDIGNNNDIVITPSSPGSGMTGSMFDSNEGWSVRHPDWYHVPAKVTLTKVDVNRWLVSTDSPSHIMDWDW